MKKKNKFTTKMVIAALVSQVALPGLIFANETAANDALMTEAAQTQDSATEVNNDLPQLEVTPPPVPETEAPPLEEAEELPTEEEEAPTEELPEVEIPTEELPETEAPTENGQSPSDKEDPVTTPPKEGQGSSGQLGNTPDNPADGSDTSDAEMELVQNIDAFTVQVSEKGLDFIQAFSLEAFQLGQESGLYTSVMLAQAYLESGYGTSKLGKAPYYNLFGIKGDYEGNFVEMLTMEQDSTGNSTQVKARFKAYPSYRESLADYVKLIKEGIQGNSLIYQGVWKEHAATYQEATKALTGVYATDIHYNQKLNKIIESYGLTKYDLGSYSEHASIGFSRKSLAQNHRSNLSLSWEIKTRAGDAPLERAEVLNSTNPGTVQQLVEFVYPVQNYQVTSRFGPRQPDANVGSSHHLGIDLGTSSNAEVFSAEAGLVVETGYHNAKGNYIVIQHASGLFTSYFHLNQIVISTGGEVAAGEIIGLVGSTGDSTGPHLHFAVSFAKETEYLDPENFLTF